MKTVADGFAKLIVSYFTVIFVIMMMPVFLILNDFTAFDGIMKYLFNE